jgi:hypothetical protein
MRLVTGLVLSALVALLAVVVVQSMPDVARYMKIREM